MANQDPFYSDVGKATKDGINHDLDAVVSAWKSFVADAKSGKPMGKPDSTLGTDTTGFQGLANEAAKMKHMADGGYAGENPLVTKLRALMSGSSMASDVNDAKAANAVDASSDTAKGYADGGAVDPSQDPGYLDKLKTVMGAMFGGSNPAINAFNPLAGMAKVGDMANSVATSAAPAVGGAIQNTGAMLAGNAPPPQAPAPAPAPMPAPQAPAPQPVTQPAVKPVVANASGPASPKSPTTDLLAKLTDNDSDKMNQLISNLQDQDKRSEFAKALAIIGDTLGNMGNAKAGQTPEGFTSLKAIQGMTDENRKHLMDQLPMQLAADPNSQTSRMAQMTLAQAMGIKPGDPRMAAISKMPAQSILQTMPQMTDAVKASLEREKNQLTSRQMGEENRLKEEEIAVSEANSRRAQQQANTTAASGALKDLSPLNPANWGLLHKARKVMSGNLSGDQSEQTVQHPNGSTITKVQ